MRFLNRPIIVKSSLLSPKSHVSKVTLLARHPWTFDEPPSSVVSFQLSNPFTNGLLAVNAGVFFISNLFPSLKMWWIKSDSHIRYGQVHRLLTSIFLHQTIQHILINSVSLIYNGPFIEKVLGSLNSAIIFIFSGVFANAVTYMLATSPLSLGASGGISGLLGGYFMALYLKAGGLHRMSSTVANSMSRSVLWYVIDILNAQVYKTNVDVFGHLAGFIGGGLAALLLQWRLPIQRQPYYRQTWY